MTKIILFSVLFLICSCKKRTPKEFEDFYVISKMDSALRNKQKSSNIPPSINGFYSRNNLIIDINDSLYFYNYKNNHLFHCFNEPNDTLPLLINIDPDNLLNVSVATIKDIINRQQIERNRCKLVIASQKDSIKNKELLKYLKEIKISYIRRTTQQEDTVLDYKKKNKIYTQDDVKWDYKKLHKTYSEKKKVIIND